MDVRVKFIDWFAGIGGFRRGMELAGHECVGFCEFDKFATASYISMHLLTDEQRNKLNELPQKKRQNGRRFKEDGEPMFTLTGQDRHGIAIEVKEATKQGYSECRVGIDSVNFSMPNSKARRERVGQEIANTLDTSCNQGIFVQVSEELTVYAVWYEKYQCYIAIRKLTPKECFRLQGWTDDYFEKAQFVNSDSQLYKQAGNGVTVNVIQAIAEGMKINDAERIS